MDIKGGAGVEAYVKALKQAAEASSGAGTGAVGNRQGGGAGDFADMVREAVGGAVEAQRHGEAVAMNTAASPKDVELLDIVTAVNDAELALQTVVAVRDRVVAAYQEIMRMPI